MINQLQFIAKCDACFAWRWFRLVVSLLITVALFTVNTMMASHPWINWGPRALICCMFGLAFYHILGNRVTIRTQQKDLTTNTYRRQWIETVLLAKFRKEHKDVTVAIVDVNSLRDTNKKSHQAGDELLELVADRLQLVVGRHRNRWVGRLGGDEFVVVGRSVCARELLAEINEAMHNKHPLSGRWGLACGGVARSRLGDTSLAMRCADLALLRAKQHFYATQESETYEYNHVLDGLPDMEAGDRRRLGRAGRRG